MLPITSFYAVLLVPLCIHLTLRVIGRRQETKISLGHGDDGELLRRSRAQGNFAETAPLMLVLLALLEAQGGPGLVLHVFGLMLICGRVLHAVALSRPGAPIGMRVAGMMLTLGQIAGTAIALLAMLILTAAQP